MTDVFSRLKHNLRAKRSTHSRLDRGETALHDFLSVIDIECNDRADIAAPTDEVGDWHRQYASAASVCA